MLVTLAVALTLALGFTAFVLANARAFGGALIRSPLSHALAVTRMIMDDDDFLGSCVRDRAQEDSDQAECRNTKGFLAVGHASG